jgi:hypothetical protein
LVIGVIVGVVGMLALMRVLNLIDWRVDYSAGAEEQWPVNVSVAAYATGVVAIFGAYLGAVMHRDARYSAPAVCVVVAVVAAATGWLVTRSYANHAPFQSGSLLSGLVILGASGSVIGAVAGRFRLGAALPAPLLVVVALAVIGRQSHDTTFGSANGMFFQPDSTTSIWIIRGVISTAAAAAVLWLVAHGRPLVVSTIVTAGVWALPAASFWWRPRCGSFWQHRGCLVDHEDWLTPFNRTTDWVIFALIATALASMVGGVWRGRHHVHLRARPLAPTA